MNDKILLQNPSLFHLIKVKSLQKCLDYQSGLISILKKRPVPIDFTFLKVELAEKVFRMRNCSHAFSFELGPGIDLFKLVDLWVVIRITLKLKAVSCALSFSSKPLLLNNNLTKYFILVAGGV